MEFFNTQYLMDILAIVLIDLVLAGDNAVVIALAVKSLPPAQRRAGITVGAGLAVALRILLTFFAAQLLLIQFVKLVGGLLILWIAVKLLIQDTESNEGARQANSWWSAMMYILVADLTMSTDNILAIAGTSEGRLGLLIFGLGLSIPFVVFTSNLLSRIMDRFPIIVILGSAVLGRVGGDMIMSDPFVKSTFDPPLWLDYGVQAALTVGVVAAGKHLAKSKPKDEPAAKAMRAPASADGN